jgi:hypothetical protein
MGFFDFRTEAMTSSGANVCMPVNLRMLLLQWNSLIFSFPCKLSIVVPSIKLGLPLYVG